MNVIDLVSNDNSNLDTQVARHARSKGISRRRAILDMMQQPGTARRGEELRRLLNRRVEIIDLVNNNANKRCKKPCEAHEVCNPASGKCVKRGGAIGSKLLGTKRPRPVRPPAPVRLPDDNLLRDLEAKLEVLASKPASWNQRALRLRQAEAAYHRAKAVDAPSLDRLKDILDAERAAKRPLALDVHGDYGDSAFRVPSGMDLVFFAPVGTYYWGGLFDTSNWGNIHRMITQNVASIVAEAGGGSVRLPVHMYKAGQFAPDMDVSFSSDIHLTGLFDLPVRVDTGVLFMNQQAWVRTTDKQLARMADAISASQSSLVWDPRMDSIGARVKLSALLKFLSRSVFPRRQIDGPVVIFVQGCRAAPDPAGPRINLVREMRLQRERGARDIIDYDLEAANLECELAKTFGLERRVPGSNNYCFVPGNPAGLFFQARYKAFRDNMDKLARLGKSYHLKDRVEDDLRQRRDRAEEAL